MTTIRLYTAENNLNLAKERVCDLLDPQCTSIALAVDQCWSFTGSAVLLQWTCSGPEYSCSKAAVDQYWSFGGPAVDLQRTSLFHTLILHVVCFSSCSSQLVEVSQVEEPGRAAVLGVRSARERRQQVPSARPSAPQTAAQSAPPADSLRTPPNSLLEESSSLTCTEPTMRSCSYRFMVIDRLGVDLQKKFEECGKKFPRKVVLQLGLRLVSGFFL